MSDRWLVIAHEASNSGAPRMLLELLRGVREARGHKWSCEILLGRGGALLADYAELGRVHVLTAPWAEGTGFLTKHIWARLDSRFLKPLRLARLAATWSAAGRGIVFSNTGTNGRLLAALPVGAGPVISHIHELAYSLHRFNRPVDLAATLARTHTFLAVSDAVACDLREMGVSPARIHRIPNFLSSMPGLSVQDNVKSEICRRLGLALNTRLIVGCGHLDPVKGTDIFADVSRLILAERRENIAFLWIGGDSDPDFARNVRNNGGGVHYVGPVESAATFFEASELVLVTSRVESFSRVVLEAGSMGRPVLAFAEARGPADLLENGCLVQNTSAVAMATAVSNFLDKPQEAGLCGARLRDKIEREFLAKKWIGETIRVIESVARA